MKANILKLKWVITYALFLFLPNANAGMSGENLYLQNCMACHAYDGSGSMPGVGNFNESREWKNKNEQSLLLQLKKGIQKEGSVVTMPPKGGNQNLTDDELKKIILYMHQTFNK